MPYGEPDIIDEHIALTERVRKLEIMNVSRTLVPKRWKPYNPAADMAYCHMVRALGLDPTTIGPLPQRIPPEVDMAYFGNEWPPIDDLWQLWLRTGYGPRYWLGDLPQHGGVGRFAFFTGSTFPRLWQAIGPDVNTEGVAHPYFDEANPPGSAPGVYMDTYPGLSLWDGSGIAVPDGGYFIGSKVIGDQRSYQTSGMDAPAPCEVPPRVDTTILKGEPHPYTVPVSNAGCPDNPLHPSFSLGYEDALYYTEDILKIEPLVPPLPVDLMPSGELASLGDVPTMPILSPVSASALRARLAIGLIELGLTGWYEGIAERAQADLQAPHRVGWQPLPLYPPWWGRLECRYDARFVTFRGRVRNNANSRETIAAYPNWLPIGPRVGSFMPAALEDGQPLMIQLDHSFRDESPDDFMKGTGSHLRVARPNLSELIESGDPQGYEIVFDGCRFGIYEGPFDGSSALYPDLRA